MLKIMVDIMFGCLRYFDRCFKKKRMNMNNCWWTNGILTWSKLVLIWIIFHLTSISCLSLSFEGNALLKFKERVVKDPFGALSSWTDSNPCAWFGVGCAGGHVVSLDLRNFFLEGTIAPELHHLWRIQFILLRNNSFSGVIPLEIGGLKRLKLLDLGYNNICRPIADETELHIPIILLDNNCESQSCYKYPDLDGNLLTSTVKVSPYSRHYDYANDIGHRRILQVRQPSSPKEMNSDNQNNVNLVNQSVTRSSSSNTPNRKSHPPNRAPHFIDFPPKPPQPPLPIFPPRRTSPPPPSPDQVLSLQPPAPQRIPSPHVNLFANPSPSTRAPRIKLILAAAVSGFIGLILGGVLLIVLRNKKARKTTEMSGQLQNAFVAGIPIIKRSELEAACEDFSNVIGISSIGTIYKGTLSNGVEIAVVFLSVTSAKDWSRNLEIQFRNKIEVLSKVNHKNFVNLIGYCEEDEPFTKLMVFEYAPNGSLFEHLHVTEAEHLDWGMRLRVAMGIAYCLDHMHQLTPPVTHPNLNSAAVSLSEDYAAKLSDFCFWNEVPARQLKPMVTDSFTISSVSLESNVFSFGLVLLEMMTGRIPHSIDNNSLNDWVLAYMRGELPLQEIVDPMMRHFDPDQLIKIGDVIRKCLHSEQNRPTMREVTTRLREATCINQDSAVPRYSSLWWAEVDARSVNGA